MPYASKLGRTNVSSRSPEAAALCDRCGFVYEHAELGWQHDWRGASLQNLRILICPRCTDDPQQQQRALVVPLDPPPIIGARPEGFVNAEVDFQTITARQTLDPITGIPTYSPVTLVTQDGENLITQPIGPGPRGRRVGLEQPAVMPLNDDVAYAVELPVLSVMANGTDVITVTCYEPHGLVTNDQISLEGLTVKEADGFYSVTVVTATMLTYQTNRPIPAQSLLDEATLVTG